jgi:homoserine O-acetyltransferase/O-succinyltransferase
VKGIKRLFSALLFLASAAALAETYPEPASGDFVLRDFRFASGETLAMLKIHYRTLGTPRRDAKGAVENAVLILHGTTGSGRQFLTDAGRYYLVLPDGIGHGDSSKPSDGLRAEFPRYTYDDMVAAQYRLLTEGLGVNHLRLVLGTSMGGMHTWVWAEKYPDFAGAHVALACLPVEISGRNRAWRKMISDDIRTDPEWRQGDYEKQPRGLTAAVQLMVLMVASPLQWQKAAPTREEADRYLAEQMRTRLAGVDANDLLYAFEASRDYDPSRGLERIEKPLLAINFADDMINPPELGIMERLIPRVRRGRYVLIPATAQTRGHATHSYPSVWQEHLKGFLVAPPG